MDIKTLSQQLNMSVQELRAKMRSAGFHVSAKANKIDNSLAREVMKKFTGGEPAAVVEEKIKKVELPKVITVRDLAALIGQPPITIIKKLIENGVMASINEEIDDETAAIVASEFGVEAEMKKEEAGQHMRMSAAGASEFDSPADEGHLQPRPPIVAVMGHVDHGKTTLLDTIRRTNVVATEAGAITQHIGAYQVKQQDKIITFLDTPGHEAFAAMRARGANVTDIIVLVVAADDGVKPQTVEVINRAKLSKTPMIVAMNKIDKPDANPERVKGELANLGVTVEDWGGNVPAVPISAKKGENIDKLLEIILLTAEVQELRANYDGPAAGAVIESHLSRGQGNVATILVMRGTLRVGDPVVVGTVHGRIRAMEDAAGRKVKEATPAMPVVISGLSDTPDVGNIFRVVGSSEEAKSQAAEFQKQERAKKLRVKSVSSAANADKRELNLIIRADVRGSLEAITEALSKLDNEDVKLNIINQLAGDITESDVQLAENTGSIIIGFDTRVTPAALKLAKQRGITIDQYDIIYELIENVTQALLNMMPIQVIEELLGRAKIKAVFLTEKKKMIVGGEVIEGKIIDKKKFRILRKKEKIGEGKVDELQHNRVAVDEVGQGEEFGVRVDTTVPIVNGDILEVYDEVVKKKDLKA